MLLTEAQLHEIAKLIEAHHNAFIANTIGPEAVAADVLEDLKKRGLIHVTVASVKDAYLYGQALAAADNPAVASMTYGQFKKWVQKNPIPLSRIEQQAVQMAQMRAGQYVRGLGNRVNATTGDLLIEADGALRAKLRNDVQTKTTENIAKRETLKQLKSELGWAMGDWTRDLDRIAVTEKHTAMQEGQADHYAKRYGPGVLVAKRPMADACPHCIRLHIGPDGAPRIFKLSTLESNGSNVGRKAAEWRAVVGATHPHCQCQMIRIPAGWGFNKEFDLVPGGTLGVHYDDESDLAMAMLQEMDLQKALSARDRLDFQGLPIVIENAAGTARHWKDASGNAGTTWMLYAYGYVDGTTGADGDGIDVYVGPDPRAENVFIIRQQDPFVGTYDEEKVMLGFPNEETARIAYQLHYDRPDFIIDITPMSVDQFKRVANATRPVEKSLRTERFVILEKAKTNPEEVASSIRADDRSPSPSGVVGPNLLFNMPARPRPKVTEGLKDVKELLTPEEQREPIKRDPEVYTVSEPMLPEPHPIVLDNVSGSGVGAGDAERNREWLEQHAKALQGPANKARPTFVISKALAGEAAASHKYVERKWMQDHWVYTYAEHHGGKVVGHYTDLGKVVLKLPADKSGKLKEFKLKYGISGDVKEANGHAYLEITQKEAAYLRTKDLTAKPKSAPAAGHAVDASEIHRLGNVQTLSPSSLKAPPTYPGYLQRGHKVVAKLGGGEKEVKLSGVDQWSHPVVRVNGKYTRLSWKDVKSAEKPVYQPSFSNLPEVAVVKPDARQLGLLDKAMAFTVNGSHSAQQYADAFWNHGVECYLVGGIVRDLVAGTSPKSQLDDAAVLKSMMDVDVVVTAGPDTAKRIVEGVDPKLEGKHAKGGILHGVKSDGSVVWGTFTAHQGGIGLDVASMVSSGGHAEPPPGQTLPETTFDHDLEEDCDRRDFTCNALFYDPQNKVILDPTGHGIEDAQNKVLRLAPSTYESQVENSFLPFRYLKFRSRGYVPEKDTLERIRKQTAEVLKDYNTGLLESALYRAFFKKGASRKATLDGIRKVMYEDGMADLYEKHIAPHVPHILNGEH